MDYAKELYELFLRDLIRDIAERQKYSDDSEDAMKSELEYIKGKMDEKGIGFLFEKIMNKGIYYQCITSPEEMDDESGKKQKYFSKYEVDFSSIRGTRKGGEDIVWILQGSGVSYPENPVKTRDDNSYDQFELLLENIDFSDRGKQLFCYTDKGYCFNGLEDNGDIIYRHKYQETTALFLNSIRKVKLINMHDKLKDLLKLCFGKQSSRSIKKINAEAVIKVAEYLSDLIPVIDENSKLKSEEQLQAEQIEVRYAVFKGFLMKGDNIDNLKNVLEKYYEDHILIKTLLEEVCDTGEFNDEQILIITEEYLDLLRQDIEQLKTKVERYKKLCKGVTVNPSPTQMYHDMWENVCVWNENFENK